MRRSVIAIAGVFSAWAVSAAAAPADAPAKIVMTTPLPHDFGFWLAILSLVVVAGGAFWLGSVTDMLRSAQPVDFGGARSATGKPLRRFYSLSQTQMTWWFGIVLASYLYIAFTNPGAGGVIPNIGGGLTDQALLLLGIGTGTALGAAMIDQVKGNQAAPTTLDAFQAVLAQLKANPGDAALIAQRDDLARRLASVGFFSDILTDVDGLSLHRVQALIWTVVIGLIFLYDVFHTNRMPTLDARILVLIGISNGAYLGFKVPEQPA